MILALWRLYFETGHRWLDLLIAGMTGTGRDLVGTNVSFLDAERVA